TDVTEILSVREKLQAQKQELDALINNIPGIVYRHKLDELWTLEYISEASQELLGFDSKILVGRKIKNLLADKSEIPWIMQQFEDAAKTRATSVMQHRMRRKDGSSIWVLNKFKCIYDQNGKAQFIDGVLVDISAQKEAEEDLIRSQGLLSMIYNGTKDSMVLLEINEEDKFVIVSANVVFKEWMKLKGIGEDQYLNGELVSCTIKHFGKSKKFAMAREAECKKATKSDIPYVSVIEGIDHKGKVQYTEKTLTAVRNDKGRCTHILVTLRDVTTQRKLELEIAKNEKQLSLIYNNANDFMGLLKVEKNRFYVESVNQIYSSQIRSTMTTPFSVEELIDMDLERMLTVGFGLDQNAVSLRIENFNNAVRSQEARAFITNRKVRNGDWHRKHHVIPIVDKGVCTHMLWVSRGINDTIAAEQKLKDAFDEVQNLKQQLEQENYYLKEEIRSQSNFENMVFASESFRSLLNKVEQVAPINVSVLLTGETGTGKELIARAIHNLGSRSLQPMIKLNCGAIPKDLVESELFGHEKGAFTGAIERKSGKFELANGSTIFLDEIGEMPYDIQVKLLRVLQEGEFERVGGTKTIKVDVRIIAATNRNLSEEVDRGSFRQDLYYRLNVFPIHIPPLRERVEDIPPLVAHFVQKYSNKHQREISFLSQDLMDSMQAYSWPGNVRELENMIERAVITSGTEALQIPELALYSNGNKRVKGVAIVPKTLAEVERAHILKTLNESKWKISGEKGAAQILGLKPSTLRDRMKKLDLKRPIQI
ncbi:MAG: sigma 54-interacting transcriptional regulator, partial [Bacteroidia bacterium]|nr:sigma 54-interacting transcriptional regulator [Bacteroidia bacterium]